MAQEIFEQSLEALRDELTKYLVSLGEKLTAEEQQRILDLVARIQHVATASGVLTAVNAQVDNLAKSLQPSK